MFQCENQNNDCTPRARAAKTHENELFLFHVFFLFAL